MGIFLGQAVATTIGKGIVSADIISGELIIAAIAGGMIWDVLTWYWGLPISESQVLIGSLIGAGISAAGLSVVQFAKLFQKVLIPMASAPVIALIFSFLFSVIIIRIFRRFAASKVNKYFRRLQILSSLYFSVSHGSNDAQKTAGIVASLLVFYGVQSTFNVPIWALLASFAALSFGTLFGGWRIVKTMGFRVTRLKPWQGFTAETSGAIVVGIASLAGFPISTTQTMSGSIIGVGATRRLSAVRWGVARKIGLAWVLTIPMSALFSFLIYKIVSLII